jgi:hypothetical protein
MSSGSSPSLDANEPTLQAADAPLLVQGDTELARHVRRHGSTVTDDSVFGPGARRQIIFVDHETDLATATAIERLLVARSEAVIVAQLRDSALRRAIYDRFEAEQVRPRPILFGLANVTIGEAIGRERLFDQAYWRDQKRVHALIFGFDAFGRACLEHAIFAGFAGRLAPPRVTILHHEPERVRTWLAREAPELKKSAEVVVHDLIDPAIGGADGAALAKAEADAPFTAIFVCLADENARLATMDALSAMQIRHDRMLAPVFVFSERRSAACALARPGGRGNDMARRFVVEGGCPPDLDIVSHVVTQRNREAERLHEAYRRAFGGRGTSSLPWAELPETFRESSRRAARHLPQKLWTAGLTWPGEQDNAAVVAPQAYATTIETCVKSTGEDDLMRRLARLEHERWCADRRLDGWSYAPTRDDAKKTHPNLVSFDDPRITDADIAKDIDQIRFLFGLTRPAPDGASAPIVIGVTCLGGIEGVDLIDAVNLLEAEKWRPLVILSALANEGECVAVARLLATLDGSGRAFRLLVPEMARGPSRTRQTETSGPSTPHALLARAETVVVPIVGPALLEEPWVDPEAPSADDALFIRYIAERANVMVTSNSLR